MLAMLSILPKQCGKILADRTPCLFTTVGPRHVGMKTDMQKGCTKRTDMQWAYAAAWADWIYLRGRATACGQIVGVGLQCPAVLQWHGVVQIDIWCIGRGNDKSHCICCSWVWHT